MADWSIPVERLAEMTGKKIETVVRLVTLHLFTSVVLRSPVDTGRFRANWNVSYGKPDLTLTDTTDPSSDGSNTTAKTSSAVLSLPVGGIVYMTNSLPYARVIEYGEYPDPPKLGSKKRGEDGYAIHVIGGYSMQAPHGVVRVSVAEFKSATDAIIRQGRTS